MKRQTTTLYFIITFLIGWSAWWSLAYASARGAQYGTPWFMVVFVLGGFSPTLGACAGSSSPKS